MYTVMRRRTLTPDITMMDIYAPQIARSAKAGQFVIYRLDELGERIPLTIADTDTASGAVTIIFQKAGISTSRLDMLREGSAILDFAGPLGEPTNLENIKTAVVVGGGLGCAIAWPIVKALSARGAHVDMIAGFRTKAAVILEDELRAASSALRVRTDDGSYGKKGFVTDTLRELLEGLGKLDRVFAVGPLAMMKFVSALTKERGVSTTVSMNPIMVDGTGMCGCCRVTVGGKVKFACVDGPDFDGHQVDFDEAIRRNAAYSPQEREAVCKLLEVNKHA